MNMHDADLKARLVRYLDRRQMPRRLEGKESAIEDELRALLAALARGAPRGADPLAEWWPHFEAALGEIIVGGSWPTEREILDASRKAGQEAPKLAYAPEQPSSAHSINAARMSRGEPVGECWLYGLPAVELIAQRLVDEQTMRQYRNGAYFARKDVQGEAAAIAWEAEAKERHEAAKLQYRTKRSGP